MSLTVKMHCLPYLLFWIQRKYSSPTSIVKDSSNLVIILLPSEFSLKILVFHKCSIMWISSDLILLRCCHVKVLQQMPWVWCGWRFSISNLLLIFIVYMGFGWYFCWMPWFIVNPNSEMLIFCESVFLLSVICHVSFRMWILSWMFCDALLQVSFVKWFDLDIFF